MHPLILAAIEDFGQVYNCGTCQSIHVQVGPVTINLEPMAYMRLVDMLSSSAANFELFRDQLKIQEER